MSPKKQDGTQSRRTETGGSPHPANNRPDEWVVKREGWGSPQSHIKFRVFTQGLCCLSGFPKPLEQVSFPGLKNIIWVRMVRMEL